MAKKESPKESQKENPQIPQLPPEVQEKLKATKVKLDKFQKILLEKFDKYVAGIALLPPPKPVQGEKQPSKDEYHILVLVDDTEPSKMSKSELRDKLNSIVESTANGIDEKLKAQTLLLSEIWQNCYDGKSELLQLISLSAPIYDKGMLSAIKIAEVHKNMVLKKFERYIVAYVLAGSLVQGKATKDSDIDVFIVIDDTDVKKMTRVELKDKLRAIIISMGYEAGEITGIRNKINIQPYILTDFWDSLKESNPVMFTFLRDGVPFYDRGIFMPWKQLLKMGKIKPSSEAIDMYMSSGEQVLDRVKFKLRDIGVEDFFWAIMTPSQAALMLYGVPPPTPKETVEVMRDIFVKKEKLLEDKDIKTLEKVLSMRKDIEHGVKKDVTGKEIDELVTSCDAYLKRLRKLFTQIEKTKDEESILHSYETIVTMIRDALRLEGVEKVANEQLVRIFEDKLISTGKVPAKMLRMLNDVIEAKSDYDEGKLTKTDIGQVRKNSNEFMRSLVEFIQRKRSFAMEKAKLKVKYGERVGEVTLLGVTAFIIRDVQADEKEIQKAEIKADGSLGSVEKSSWEEFEKALAKIDIPEKPVVKAATFESLKKVFGMDVEVLL